MKSFNTMSELVDFLAVEYGKSKGKSLASWHIDKSLMLTGVYDSDDELIDGFIIYKDPLNDYRWTVIDNFHAELATRFYVEYIQEMQDALALYAMLEGDDEYSLPDDEVIEESEIGFYEDLD